MRKKTRLFLKIFDLAQKKYHSSSKRLAGDAWPLPWQTLIATILSAQTRDEVTIPVAEKLFSQYPSLKFLSQASHYDILAIIKSINYNKKKAMYIRAAAQYILQHHQGEIPATLEELLKISGVGRKTANLILSEVHHQDSITIDTHCHRILNVLGIVKTKTPHQTEFEMRRIAPIEYWSRINRIFVLLGKEVSGRDEKKILAKLYE